MNGTSVLPGVGSPLKVFILGVPKCNPDARVLIKHPMSGLGGAGFGGEGDGPVGVHPPSGHAGAGDGDGCPRGTHPPPLRKVTSWSSHWDSCSLMGFPIALVEGYWGVCSAHGLQSPVGDPPRANAICNQRGCQAPLGDDSELPH